VHPSKVETGYGEEVHLAGTPSPLFLYTDFMSTLARDTSADAESVMLGIFRKMPAWRRLELLDEACSLSLELARAGLRRRNSQASDEAIERLLRQYHSWDSPPDG